MKEEEGFGDCPVDPRLELPRPAALAGENPRAGLPCPHGGPVTASPVYDDDLGSRNGRALDRIRNLPSLVERGYYDCDSHRGTIAARALAPRPSQSGLGKKAAA